MMRWRTQVPQREPPYARDTVRWRFETDFISMGRRAGIPLIFRPQSPHFGPLARFLRYWRTFLPPGVLTTLTCTMHR